MLGPLLKTTYCDLQTESSVADKYGPPQAHPMIQRAMLGG